MPKRKCDAVNLTIGQRLKKYRDACGLTQQQVADVLSINRTTYTKYETGVSEPSHDLLKKIVNVYGTDFNAVLGDKDTFERDVYDCSLPMYNLTKDEQELVIGFRSLGSNQKEILMDKMVELIAQANDNKEL